MPSHFGRGFEAFGRPIPLHGAPPVAPADPNLGPVHMAQPVPPGQVRLATARPAAAPLAPAQARPVPPGRIQVFRKGDPGAPPCPVCRG
jgi:hypothetical protein